MASPASSADSHRRVTLKAREISDLLPGSQISGAADVEIKGVVYDSRKAGLGFLFVALRGHAVDGHSYIPLAINSGASALLVQDDWQGQLPGNIAIIKVADTRGALAAASAAFYNYPSRALQVYAVTGTNGKTSTTILIESILCVAGIKTGIIGTLGAKIGDEEVALSNTTPESCDLQQLFARMRDSGVQAVAMEASSHALSQHRMDYTEVDTAIFTNLTQDHLDYHHTMEDYFQAKQRLFTEFPLHTKKDFVSAVNIDDPWGREHLAYAVGGRLVTFGSAADAMVHFSEVRYGPSGTAFSLDCSQGSIRVELSLGGLFMAYNAMSAAAACLERGVAISDVKAGLEAVRSVPGRFELINYGQEFVVIVDYAHTPDGLENVLSSARKVSEGRVIAVFGCGGDRDPAKRPMMGEIAVRLADIPILTSDNPRSEDPAAIVSDVMSGIPSAEKVIVKLDRRKAIEEACRLAQAGDVVVVAGKGHETYQIFADCTIHFDDREIVRETLQRVNKPIQNGASR